MPMRRLTGRLMASSTVWEVFMRYAIIGRYASIGLLMAMLAATSACSNMSDQQQRALSGGAIGAGGGAVLGAVAGFNPLVGALVGDGAGAAVGALTSDPRH